MSVGPISVSVILTLSSVPYFILSNLRVIQDKLKPPITSSVTDVSGVEERLLQQISLDFILDRAN